jgi:hypothetical protein
MNPDAVTTNHSIPHFGLADPRRDEPAHFPGDDSLFKEPISADVPRRAIDRKILESYDAVNECAQSAPRSGGTVMSNDAVTELADDLTSSFLSLETQLSERRSGKERRLDKEPDSARQFKQEVEREYRAEIRQLREESAEKDKLILILQSEFVQLRTEFQQYRDANQKPLEAAQAMAEASRTMQKAMATLIAIMMAIGGTAASIEAFRKWMGHAP